MKKFVVLSSEPLEFGGHNVHLQSSEESDLAGLSYWGKFNNARKVGETIEINMDNVVISSEETKDGHAIRVLRPKV